MSCAVRIAMWSGPRNISTAMMRAFENRTDCLVWDEPFYACYLGATGLDHPMREAIIAAYGVDWRAVIGRILGPLPPGKTVHYQKHMTHHMIPAFERAWINSVTSAFLIRSPERVLASYTKKRERATLGDIGYPAQGEIFDRVADRLGRAPPVIEDEDLLADPRGVLGALCQACGIAFDERMLSWPCGRRASDGIWASHWYNAVEASTGFMKPERREAVTLAPDLARIADAARPDYERLRRYRLAAGAS